MRIWQEDDPPQREWLASLEDPTTKQLTYFKTIEALFAFLQKQSGIIDSETNPHNDAREEHNRPLVE